MRRWAICVGVMGVAMMLAMLLVGLPLAIATDSAIPGLPEIVLVPLGFAVVAGSLLAWLLWWLEERL